MRNSYRKKMVVIVDDDADSRDLIRDTISTPQIGFIEAATAEKAISLMDNYVVDVAVVDVFMPGRGGIWLIKEIRKRGQGIKIISISGGYGGMPSDDAVHAAEKIGADIAITKPINIKEFRKTILMLLDRRP